MTRSDAPPASPTFPPRALAIESNSSALQINYELDLKFDFLEVIKFFIYQRKVHKVQQHGPNDMKFVRLTTC